MTIWYEIKSTPPPNRIPIIVWDADNRIARSDEWIPDAKRWVSELISGGKANITHWTILERPE